MNAGGLASPIKKCYCIGSLQPKSKKQDKNESTSWQNLPVKAKNPNNLDRIKILKRTVAFTRATHLKKWKLSCVRPVDSIQKSKRDQP